MKVWQKVTLATLFVVLIAGVRIYFVWKSRQDPGVAPPRHGEEAARPLTKDELVVMRQLFISTFDSAKQLEGTTVWVKAGYTLPYYPFVNGQVQFNKRVGLLPSAEKLAIAKIQKAVVPAKEDNRVPHGTRQYFAIFALPGKPDLYAAPIGFVQGNDETFYCDQLFYYDDPKTIYDHWPQSVWEAVAAHTPKVGMTENQTRMAVGILQQSDSQTEGDRIVTYNTAGKTWTVTFQHGVATQVKAGDAKSNDAKAADGDSGKGKPS
jgi:hypothetical protein